MRAFIPALVVLAMCTGAAGQEFLRIGVGARALGMGGAFTAVSDDASALAWNPAGLGGLSSKELATMHAELAGVSRYDFVGYAHPTGAGTVAAGARRLSQGGLEGRDASGGTTGTFSASDTAVDLAYGLKAGPRASLGASARYIRGVIAGVSAQTFALDLGGLYRLAPLGPGTPQLGAAVQNLGPGLRFLDERAALPLTVAGGLGYRLPVGLLLAADVRHSPEARSTEASVGTEYALHSSFAVRVGYAAAGASGRERAPGLRGMAGGFGLKGYGYSLDYSAAPFGELGSGHRFSLGARF